MTRRALAITALLLATWLVRTRLVAPHPVDYDGSLSTFPSVVGSWTGHDVRLEADILSQIRVDDYLNRYYRSGDGLMGLYVAYYASQKPGDAVHSPLNCLPGSGWQPIDAQRVGLDAAAGTRSVGTINQVVVAKGLDQQLVLYWYQTVDRVVASEYLSKAFLVRDAFGSGRTDIALVRIVAPINSQRPDAVATALSLARPFAERVLPEIRQRLFRS